MFSGVGGFELGIQRAFDSREHKGQERPRSIQHIQRQGDMADISGQPLNRPICIGYSEIDKYAIETYEHNFKGHKNYGDATTINERELPDFDLLVGGFPCQAFSIAGKRKGFDDTRGTLFFDIARILAYKRPRHLVLENVKGLLSHEQGKTFQTILGVLTDLGYRVEWQVLNAKDFGVPQNRERVFIVGHLGGECRHQVFPITRANRQNVQQGADEQSSRAWVSTLDSRYGERWSTETYVRVKAPNGKEVELEDRPTPYQLLETRTELGKKTRREIRQAEGRDSTKRGKADKKFVPKNDNLANALTTGQANIEKWTIEPGIKIRRLTPLECERLMSWPDGWTIGSDTQRYKQCGNGVVSNVVQAVMERLFNH